MIFNLHSNPKQGEEKITNSFLWLPVRIGGERRWLKKSKIRWTARRMWDVTCGSEWMQWTPREFL
jgi:hypothetical protein